MWRFVIIVGFFLSVLSCTENSETEKIIEQDSVKLKDLDMTPEMAIDVFEQMPSVKEISKIIHKSNIPYSNKYLNPISNINKYSDINSQALGFGVYATDLDYVGFYNDSNELKLHLDALIQLAFKLKIEHCFDFNSLNLLIHRSPNSDSMMLKTMEGFEKIEDYLVTSQRGDLGAIILTGGWVEAMYLSAKNDSLGKYVAIKDKICDQKMSLTKIVELLKVYQHNKLISSLIVRLNNLLILYSNIKVEEKTRNAKIVEKDGTPIYEDTKDLKIDITDIQYKQLKDTLISIRTDFVKHY